MFSSKAFESLLVCSSAEWVGEGGGVTSAPPKKGEDEEEEEKSKRIRTKQKARYAVLGPCPFSIPAQRERERF